MRFLAWARVTTKKKGARSNLICSLGLLGKLTIPTDNLQLRIGLLNVLDHLHLVDGVALRRVQHDDVHPVGHQQLETRLVLHPCTDGGANQQLLVGVLGGVRIGACLLQIGTGNHGDQFPILINDRQLALFALLQNGIRCRQINAIGGCYQFCGHDVPQQDLRLILTEINITGCNHAEQFATKFTILGNRIACEAVFPTCLQDITHRICGRHHRGIAHEAVLVLLNLVHLQRLVFRRAVVMDDANATTQLHEDDQSR